MRLGTKRTLLTLGDTLLEATSSGSRNSALRLGRLGAGSARQLGLRGGHLSGSVRTDHSKRQNFPCRFLR